MWIMWTHSHARASSVVPSRVPSSSKLAVDFAACLRCVAAGVWDHWDFEEASAALCDLEAPPSKPLTTRTRVMDFFEETRAKGEEAFGDGADNLTGIVAVFHAAP